MPLEITYTQARDSLAKLLNDVTENREIVIIKRRDGEDAALISADELASLVETAYLLRSPANARRLLAAVNRALGEETQPSDIESLRRAIGLDG